jgi:hypothetical protein
MTESWKNFLKNLLKDFLTIVTFYVIGLLFFALATKNLPRWKEYLIPNKDEKVEIEFFNPKFIQVKSESVVDNCDGLSAVSVVTKSVSRGNTSLYGINYTTQPGLSLEQINKLSLQISQNIQKTYQEGISSTFSDTVSVHVQAPEGKAIKHYFTWNEIIINGKVHSDSFEDILFEYPVGIEFVVRDTEEVDCKTLSLDAGEVTDGTITPPDVGSLLPNEPILEHQTLSVGTGVFEKVTHSNGMAEYSYNWLVSNQRLNIQRIRKEENPDGCGTAFFNTNSAWFTGGPGANVIVNGEIVGTYTALTTPHGYIIPIDISIGDKICITNSNVSGYSLIFGPDMYINYDSYCYRGHCH